MIEEDSFTEGLAFDGSSIRGWKAINASDMSMVPDASTAWIDPFYKHKTLSMICSIQEPRSGEPYDRCPRSLAQKALKYLESTGIADTAFFGPEPEFFLFDDVRYDSKEGSCFYSVDTIEAPWNTGRIEEGGNLGYKIQYKEGYFPVSPNDTAQDIRSEMLLLMGELGIPTEKHHHEVAGAGQHELGMKFDSLINSADNVMTYKYVVRNVAKKYGKTATFMPKPVFNDNGTGMHVHQSLWKSGQPLFFGEGAYANLSQTARWYISVMMLAGIDGIKNQIDPGDGVDVDLFELPADELAKIDTVPSSLNDSLNALKADKDYLLAGGVFTEDFIDNFIDIKYEEVQQLRQRPHPHEFFMYYDA